MIDRPSNADARVKERDPVDPDPLDDLLADYLDWIDRGHAGDVSAFLADHPLASVDSQLVGRLQAYVHATRPLEQLAALTTASWIDGQEVRAVTETSEGPDNPPAAAQQTLPADFGEYELLEEIGRGGMGVVYKARHKPLGRVVCLKMILLGPMAGAQQIVRFRAEAKAMARLRHPNLVMLYEVGRHDGQDYFSMEYIPGRTLADRAGDPSLHPAAAAQYLQAIARAIDYAHANGILHRDLKPSNVLIDPLDQPRVTDFGLARHIDTGSLTKTGMLLGTPAYMPPEQTLGDPQGLDARADVYGLGAILYQLLTGRPPFCGKTPLDTLLQVRHQEPVAPSVGNRGIPRELEIICLKCLEKDPSRRYASAAALADDVERFLRCEPIAARPIGRAQRFARWCGRNPLLFGSGAVITLSLIVVTVTALAAYRTTAAALIDTRHARDAQAGLAAQLRRERDVAENHLYLAQIQQVRQTIENGNLIEADELLQQQIPQQHEIDRRGWEWHYLSGLLRQFERSLEGHEGAVHAVAWSPDGGQLASVGEDQSLRLWESQTGNVLKEIMLPGGTPVDVGWSPEGDRLATGHGDGAVRVWDAATGNLLRELRDGNGTPCSLAWSPRSNRLAVAQDDGRVVLWNPSTAAVQQTLFGHRQQVNSVAWNGEGIRLATGSDDGTVRVWDPGDGRCLAVLPGDAGWINAVAWSADGRRIAAVAQDAVLRAWTLGDDAPPDGVAVDERYTRVAGQRGPLLSVAWSEDDRFLVTGGAAPRLLLWDAEQGTPIGPLRGHRDTTLDLAWHPERPRVASASSDSTIKIWASDARLPGSPLQRSASPVRTVAGSADRRWLAWREVDGLVTVWDTEARHGVLKFAESVLGATALAWHPRKPQLALAREHAVVVFSVPEGKETLRLEGHTGPVWSIAWDPSGTRIATGSNDQTLIIWSSETGRILRTLADHAGDVRCAVWSPDGRRLATADRRAMVRIWQAETGRLLRTLSCGTAAINALAWSPVDASLVVATHEGTISRWHVETGRKMPSLAGHQGDVWSVVCSRRGDRLFSCGQDGTMRVWDLRTSQEILQLAGHNGPLWSLSFGPDHRLATSGVDGTVRLWQAMADPLRRGR